MHADKIKNESQESCISWNACPGSWSASICVHLRLL